MKEIVRYTEKNMKWTYSEFKVIFSEYIRIEH